MCMYEDISIGLSVTDVKEYQCRQDISGHMEKETKASVLSYNAIKFF